MLSRASLSPAPFPVPERQSQIQVQGVYNIYILFIHIHNYLPIMYAIHTWIHNPYLLIHSIIHMKSQFDALYIARLQRCKQSISPHPHEKKSVAQYSQ